MAKNNATQNSDLVRISVMVPSAIKEYINLHYKTLSEGVTAILRNAIAEQVVAKHENHVPEEPVAASPAPRKQAAPTTPTVSEHTLVIGEYSARCWYVVGTTNENKDVINLLKGYGGHFRREFKVLDNRAGYYVQKSKVSLADLTAAIAALGYGVTHGDSVAEAQAANAEAARAARATEEAAKPKEKPTEKKSKVKPAKQETKPASAKLEYAPIATEEYTGTLHGCSKAGAHKTKGDVKFYAVPNEEGLYYYQLGQIYRIAMCLSHESGDFLDLGLAECEGVVAVNCGGKLKNREQFNYFAENWHAVAYQDGKVQAVPAWVIEAYATVPDSDCKAVAAWLMQYAA